MRVPTNTKAMSAAIFRKDWFCAFITFSISQTRPVSRLIAYAAHREDLPVTVVRLWSPPRPAISHEGNRPEQGG